jgi:hypothetical protein
MFILNEIIRDKEYKIQVHTFQLLIYHITESSILIANSRCIGYRARDFIALISLNCYCNKALIWILTLSPTFSE